MSDRVYVLCVDDEPNVLRSYKRALRNEDYGVLFAQSGLEALELLKKFRVRVVISDFRMAEMNGIELVQEVIKFDSSIGCAVLSGYADEVTVQQALKTGQIRRFLLKPIDNADLRNEIRTLLKQSLDNREGLYGSTRSNR